jgi:transposase-like protein
VLDAVRAEPGKTVAEYAAILGVAPTALYRPVRRLANEGALVNRARQLFPDGP